MKSKVSELGCMTRQEMKLIGDNMNYKKLELQDYGGGSGLGTNMIQQQQSKQHDEHTAKQI